MHASANIPLIWSSGNEHFSQFSTMYRESGWFRADHVLALSGFALGGFALGV